MICRFVATLGNKRKLLFAVVVLFIVSALLVACSKGEKERPLFPGLKAWDLKSLRITARDDRVLMFKRKNCVWTLGPEALAANEARVTALADRIVGISYRQDLGAQKDNHAKYLPVRDSFSYRIDLGLPDGKSKTLYLGGGDGAAATHVRTTDDEKTYVFGRAAIRNITMANDFWLAKSD